MSATIEDHILYMHIVPVVQLLFITTRFTKVQPAVKVDLTDQFDWNLVNCGSLTFNWDKFDRPFDVVLLSFALLSNYYTFRWHWIDR